MQGRKEDEKSALLTDGVGEDTGGPNVPLSTAWMVVARCPCIGDGGHLKRLQDVAHVAHAHLNRHVGLRAAVVHLEHPLSRHGCGLAQGLGAVEFRIQPVLLIHEHAELGLVGDEVVPETLVVRHNHRRAVIDEGVIAPVAARIVSIGRPVAVVQLQPPLRLLLERSQAVRENVRPRVPYVHATAVALKIPPGVQ